jgi:O-antigen/teichoic acid export membrane protein
LKLLAAVLVAQQLLLFYQFLLRAQDSFALLSKIFVTAAVLELAASVALVYWRGFNGIFYGLFISCAAGALIGFIAERRIVSRLELDFRLIGSLIRIGFPIMLTTLGYGLLTTIDRMLIIKFLGSEALGYYSIGSLAITAISYLPIAINQVMYPKFGERYGATDDPKSLAGFVRVTTLGTAHAMGLVLGAAFIALPVITILLPKYLPGIPAARILFAGFYFISLLGPSANLLLTINRQVQYLVGMGAAITLEVVLNGLALAYGLGLEGVAVTTGIVYAICAFGIIGYAVRGFLAYNWRQFGAMVRKLLLPYGLAAATIFVVLQLRVGSLFFSTVAQTLLFTGIYGLCSFFIMRRELPR